MGLVKISTDFLQVLLTRSRERHRASRLHRALVGFTWPNNMGWCLKLNWIPWRKPAGCSRVQYSVRLCPLAATNDVLSIFTTLLPLLWSLLVRSTGSRIPLPDKKAELLNTNALKRLLPGSPDRSTGVGSSGGGAENAETAELLARLRKPPGQISPNFYFRD